MPICTRARTTPDRYEREKFIPGANNKYTVGRDIDMGHTVEVEGDEFEVGDFYEVDRDYDPMCVESEEESDEESEEESEGEWDSEEESEEASQKEMAMINHITTIGCNV
ncbi:MAG: hypothetical protein CMB73_05555 [Euryarchaeota archaeon]|nr:hypothetical protein [Euryarchaeota archaeon]